jgi:hypothetical protein
MANITESPLWEQTIYEISNSDRVIGGVDSVINIQTNQLANRTRYLKEQLDKISDTSNKAGGFLLLSDSGTISRDILPPNVMYTTERSSVVPGTYNQVTIDEYGIVVEACNVSSFSELGITDSVTKAQVQTMISDSLRDFVTTGYKNAVVLVASDDTYSSYQIPDDFIVETLLVTLNGVVQNPTNDYIISISRTTGASSVVFTSNKISSDVVRSYYFVKF